MALPWLIGGAVVAVATATIAALSDDSSSSSSSYSDNEDAERRRAARERAERQREERMEALDASYNERLELDGKKMTSLLRTMAKVDNVQESMVIIEVVPELEMNPDGSYKDVLTRQIVQNKSTLDSFHSNVVLFDQLYGGYIEPKTETIQISEAIDTLEKQTKKIDDLIKELG
ncbi:hypothetical protein [Psychrobacter fulvigenes]|uniref:hypothetical protein n=1 Tax=Psychrobacter fulvigenes TaxID=533323 RepID=UPI00191A8823|nr:hypothetical protein [Psychrobacter fulvigenes]